jgi:hypothetical protein
MDSAHPPSVSFVSRATTIRREDTMTLMIELSSQRERITDVLSAIQRLNDQMQGLEGRLTKEIGSVRADLTKEIGSVRADGAKEIGSLRADLTKEIGSVKADLMKWSFLFWVGAVSAIAMLAGVLQR